MEITDEQVSQLKRAANIGRADYSNAKWVERWVYDILDGKDVSKELKQYEDDDD